MNEKCMWSVISTVLLKLKDFSRSQAVVISRKLCKRETLLPQTTNRKWHWIVAIPRTWSEVQGHASIAGLLKCDFFHSFAVVDNISTELNRHAIPLQQLTCSSFLFLNLSLIKEYEYVQWKLSVIVFTCHLLQNKVYIICETFAASKTDISVCFEMSQWS